MHAVGSTHASSDCLQRVSAVGTRYSGYTSCTYVQQVRCLLRRAAPCSEPAQARCTRTVVRCDARLAVPCALAAMRGQSRRVSRSHVFALCTGAHPMQGHYSSTQAFCGAGAVSAVCIAELSKPSSFPPRTSNPDWLPLPVCHFERHRQRRQLPHMALPLTSLDSCPHTSSLVSDQLATSANIRQVSSRPLIPRNRAIARGCHNRMWSPTKSPGTGPLEGQGGMQTRADCCDGFGRMSNTAVLHVQVYRPSYTPRCPPAVRGREQPIPAGLLVSPTAFERVSRSEKTTQKCVGAARTVRCRRGSSRTPTKTR